MSERSSLTDLDLREIRRRWASGVVVVTTVDGVGGFRGATVSAFTAVSLEPPLVLVCLDRSGRMSGMVPEAGIFAVSILESNQEFLAERFAGRAPLPDKVFTGVLIVRQATAVRSWTEHMPGTPAGWWRRTTA